VKTQTYGTHSSAITTENLEAPLKTKIVFLKLSLEKHKHNIGPIEKYKIYYAL